VRTGADGEAILRWFDGNAVRISPNTSIIISGITAAPAEKTTLELKQGGAFFKAKALSGADSTFSVKTPSAIAGVRGTQFSASVDAAGKTTVSVLDGQIDVEAEGISIVLDPGFQITVETGQPPGEIAQLPAEVKTALDSDSKSVAEALSAPAPAEEKKPEVKKEEKKAEPPKTEEKKPEPKPEAKKEEKPKKEEPKKQEEKKEETKPTEGKTNPYETTEDVDEAAVENMINQEILNNIVDDIIDQTIDNY